MNPLDMFARMGLPPQMLTPIVNQAKNMLLDLLSQHGPPPDFLRRYLEIGYSQDATMRIWCGVLEAAKDIPVSLPGSDPGSGVALTMLEGGKT